MSRDDDTAWIPDSDTFSCRLFLVRREMSWSIREASMACGFRPELWSSWELRAATPADLASVCRRIRDRTGVDAYWLMTGAPPIEPRPRSPAEQQQRRRNHCRALPPSIGTPTPTPFTL